MARAAEELLLECLRGVCLGFQAVVLKKTKRKTPPAGLLLLWAMSAAVISRVCLLSGSIGESGLQEFRSTAADEYVIHSASGFFGSMEEEEIEESRNLFLAFVRECDRFIDGLFERRFHSIRSMVVAQLEEGTLAREAIKDPESSAIIAVSAVGIAIDSFEKARSLKSDA